MQLFMRLNERVVLISRLISALSLSKVLVLLAVWARIEISWSEDA